MAYRMIQLSSPRRILANQSQKTLHFDHLKKLWGIFRLGRSLISFKACKILLGTLCLGRCPKKSFHLIYALAVKVVYLLNSADRSVKCKGHRCLLLLVPAKCDGKLSLILKVFNQWRNVAYHP